MIPPRHKKTALLLIFVFLNHLITASHFLYAQSSNQNLSITYENRLLTISAKDADLKNVLLKLAEKTNTQITFPGSLEKQVTINKKSVSLREALKSLLHGLNHAIIYSVTNKKNVIISRVRVFADSKKSSLSQTANRRITNRIRAYERQIRSLKNNLSRVDENSRRGKSYLSRISRLEEKIRSLERQQ